jgi:plastocyanin
MPFEPTTLVVNKGDTVVWTQNSTMPHAVKASAGKFGSDIIRTGQTFSQIFNEAGSYHYHCSLHPSMRGRIVVR